MHEGHNMLIILSTCSEMGAVFEKSQFYMGSHLDW